MTLPTHRLLATTLTLLLLATIAFIAYLLWTNALHTAREHFVKEQIQVFEECHDKALTADPPTAAANLQYATHYYPSGSKQETGSPLDWTVEHERQRVITEIISSLK